MFDRYAEAWNGHDPEGVAACARALFEGFSDVHFDIVNVVEDGGRPAAFESLMKATNTGSFGGAAPTGREVRLPGADFLAFDSAGEIAWLRGSFDLQSPIDQLGAA